MIGLFDSGIGGLTVVRELLLRAPNASFIYLGDTARTPYGNKSAETVTRYSLEIAAFLVAHGATSIVIACNSASAVATQALREKYPDIPVFEVIAPAVEDALKVTKGKIGVIGTRATIASRAYELRLADQESIEVMSLPCPLFVPMVEEGWLEEAETKRIARHYLSPLRMAAVDTLILGCTHYPLLSPVIQRYMGSKVKLIDSGAAVVSRLLSQLPDRDQGGVQQFYLTDVSSRSEDIAENWLGRRVVFEPATIA